MVFVLKKIFSVIMSFIILLSCSLTCFALATKEAEIQPYYTNVETIRTSLSISGGNASCIAKLTGVSGKTTKVTITMTLEKKVLFWWSEQETWTQTFNSYNGTLSKNYSGANSGTYRITAEYIAYSGTNSETITDTSSEVKA